MNVAILFGDRSQTTVDVLKKEIDDVDLKPYNSLEGFKNYIKQSSANFERMVINTNAFDIHNRNTEMQELYNFLRDYLPATGVVFIVQATDTSNVQVDFHNIFDLSIYTDATASRTSVSFILECVKNSITDIREKYSAVAQDEGVGSILSENYNETPDNTVEDIVALQYVEPIISSADSNQIDPKDDNLKREVLEARRTNAELQPIIGNWYKNELTNGHLDNMHYPFDLADVDPTILLAKQRRRDDSPIEIHVNKMNLEFLSKSLDPITKLRLAYAESGVLSASSLFDNMYIARPLVNMPVNTVARKSNNKNNQSTAVKEKKSGIIGRIIGGIFGGRR